MLQPGSNRGQRVTKALVSIAPAVLHGGFSTFLAVVLLSVSDVYVLKTFFKVTTGSRMSSKLLAWHPCQVWNG